MKVALFPGSFDPPTLGHLNIIKRSQSMCDKLFVAIGTNASKPDELFNIKERKTMLEKICTPFSHVEVVSYSTLTVEFAKANKVDFLLRGLRTVCDFEAEVSMAVANQKLSGIDTVFLIADEKMAHISSTLICEIGKFNRRLHDFVPQEIENEVFKRLSLS